MEKSKLENLPSLEGSNPEKSPSTGPICAECSELDFSGVLKEIKERRQQDPWLYRPLVVANVGHRFRQARETDCPLCLMLFASRIQTSSIHPKGEAEDDYDELRAKSFLSESNLFDFSRSEGYMGRTNDSLCLVVMPRHLPRWNSSAAEIQAIEDSSDSMPFVALSYVWSESSATDCEKKDDTGTRLVASSLPATISDAITVTRALGYQYLWIDKFCIDQDNPGVKHHQIKQMDAIYEQAELTIIAAAGIDENHGLPGVGRTPRSPQWIAQLHGASVIWTPPDPHNSIRSSKWSTRGWTFQEGLLSRRRLAFTKDQVYFECKAMNCFESVRSPLDDMHNKEKTRMLEDLRGGMFGRNARMEFGEGDRHSLVTFPRFIEYLMAVEEYTVRNLRYDADVLHAFRGIERYFNREDTMRGFYGIPYPKGFPSWSWAGWVGQVAFSYQGHESFYGVPLHPMWLEGDSSTMVLQPSIYDSIPHETDPLRPILRVEGIVLPPKTISYRVDQISYGCHYYRYEGGGRVKHLVRPVNITVMIAVARPRVYARCPSPAEPTDTSLLPPRRVQRPDDAVERLRSAQPLGDVSDLADPPRALV
ncbi:hypothetical protein DL771_002550 [Monosporascus sp. 5C6A]|nr:hypothetical protein DL771_002550 [Monosporascus sp. 5C6A]